MNLFSRFGICLFVFYVFPYWQTFGQTQEVYIDEEEKGATTIAQFWTEADGLPFWAVFGFFEDSRGVVWLQSGDNLSYYDGAKVVQVEDNPQQLYQHKMVSFAEDKYHNIWRYQKNDYAEGPKPGKIDIYDPSMKRFYPLEAYLKEQKGIQLSGQLMLFSIEEVVYVFDTEYEKLWKFDGSFELALASTDSRSPKKGKTTYLPGPADYYWSIGSTEIQLLNSYGTPVATYDGNALGITCALSFLAKDKTLWVADQQSRAYHPLSLPPELAKSVPTAERSIIPVVEVHRGYYRKVVTAINKDDWPFPTFHLITYSGALYEFSRAKQGLKPSNLLTSIDEAIAGKKILADVVLHATQATLRDGSMLIGVESGFLHIKRVRNYFRKYLPNERIRSISTTNDGRIAVTAPITSGLTVKELELNTGLSDSYKLQISPSYAFAVSHRDSINWVGLANGNLVQYDKKWQKIKAFNISAHTGYQEVRSLTYKDKGTIWYGTNTGLVEVDLSSEKSNYIWTEGQVKYIHLDRCGEYWLGTENGLYHYNSGQYYLDSLNGKGLSVSHVFEDEDGVFWISSQRGLIKWKPYGEYYEQYDGEDGFSSDIIHCAYPDRLGRLWLSSNHGVMSFDTASKQVSIYYTQNGLAGDEQNFMAHLQRSDGQLLFGGQKGITAFDPNQIPGTEHSFHYPFTLNYITLLDEEGAAFDTLGTGEIGEVIQLTRRANQLSIHFFFPAYLTAPFKIEWQLNEGDSWQDISPNHSVFISGLPYGASEVNIRARYTQGSTPPLYHSIRFYKPYPVYHSFGFWLMAALFSIALVGLLLHYKSRRIIRANKELSEKVKERTIELETEKKKLEELDTAKSRLFRSLSHELRTPISVISAIVQQYMDSRDTISQSELSTIQQEANQLDKLISGILKLSKLEMGSVKAEPITVEWDSLISRIFELFRPLANQKHLNYQLKLDGPEEEKYVQIDADKLEHILSNLITNAIKFTHPGGSVCLQSSWRENQIELIVADNGIGIPKAEQQSIFKRYYQGRNTKAKQGSYGGFGIGLALCNEYLALMDGKISVNSSLGMGASFLVQLPLTLASAPENSPSGATQSQQQPTLSTLLRSNGHRARLLIVEDNDLLRKYLKLLLANQYDVDTCANGKEAFDRLSAKESSYDVIISDIMMPVVDGLSLLQKVRKHPDLSLTPILFLTALADDEERLKAIRLGVDSFIPKPFQKEALLAQIENLVKRNQTRRQAQGNLALAEGNKAVAKEAEAEGVPVAVQEAYDEAWLQKLDGVIRENLSKPDFKIPDLSTKMFVSERTLRNYIKAYTGLTPTGYLQKARLDQANLLLLKRKYKTLGEVAYAVGFKDAQYFSKLFKKEFGQSPTDFLC